MGKKKKTNMMIDDSLRGWKAFFFKNFYWTMYKKNIHIEPTNTFAKNPCIPMDGVIFYGFQHTWCLYCACTRWTLKKSDDGESRRPKIKIREDKRCRQRAWRKTLKIWAIQNTIWGDRGDDWILKSQVFNKDKYEGWIPTCESWMSSKLYECFLMM